MRAATAAAAARSSLLLHLQLKAFIGPLSAIHAPIPNAYIPTGLVGTYIHTHTQDSPCAPAAVIKTRKRPHIPLRPGIFTWWQIWGHKTGSFILI